MSEQLFDLTGEEKKKQAEKEKAQRKPAAAPPRPQAKKYPEGTTVHHASGRTKTLEKEMTEGEVYDLMNDDFPEINREQAELRYDEKKGRIYFVTKMQKKGARAGAL
jgi:hypothetical protein